MMKRTVEMAAPIAVRALSVGLRFVSRYWVDSRDGFSELYGDRMPERWVIEPR